VPLAHRVEQVLAAVELAQVAGTGDGFRAVLLDPFGGCREVRRRGRRKHQACSLTGKLLGDRPADPAAPTGYDNDFPGKLARH
jgi:hypothetical protein